MRKQGDKPARGALAVTGGREPFEKYRSLLKNGVDLEKLKESTAHPRVQMLLNPGLLEKEIIGLGGESHPFHKMILPFLAAAGLAE